MTQRLMKMIRITIITDLQFQFLITIYFEMDVCFIYRPCLVYSLLNNKSKIHQKYIFL